MGTTQSHNEECAIVDDESISMHKKFYYDKYNWLPSLPGFEYDVLDIELLKRKYHSAELKEYVDLRTSFPEIRSIDNLPFNPILSTIYVLQYQLLKNKLPVFPPSPMYIYKNIDFYQNIKTLFSFECIFKSILTYGFCSESEYPTIKSNINCKISNALLEKATAFKFIQIYKLSQDINVIQTLLSNQQPILVGLSVYYDWSNIDSTLWMPDKKNDIKLGGLTVVLVGYINEREMFIAATTFGKCFGSNGFIMIPYEYILNSAYTGELYALDFKSERVEGYINQRKEMVNLQNNKEIQFDNKQKYKQDSFGSLFK